MSDANHSITSAVGEYSEEAKMLAGQKRKLEEFPCLQAVNSKWPIKELLVSNSAQHLMSVLDRRFDPRFDEMWVYVETESHISTLILPRFDPRDRRARMFRAGEKWGSLLRECPAEPVMYIIFVRYDEERTQPKTILLCRHKNRGTSLNNLIDVWLRVNQSS